MASGFSVVEVSIDFRFEFGFLDLLRDQSRSSKIKQCSLRLTGYGCEFLTQLTSEKRSRVDPRRKSRRGRLRCVCIKDMCMCVKICEMNVLYIEVMMNER